MAEKELNLELDNIKNGKLNTDNNLKNKSNAEGISLSKSINLIDESRGIYMVTVEAKIDEENVRLEGYERYGGADKEAAKGENIVK